MGLLSGSSILITGGTGSFGHAFVKYLLSFKEDDSPRRIIVFSRDEFKQHEMNKLYPEDRYPQMRYYIGDVRDKQRVLKAFDRVDYVIHAAAIKHVPVCEYNPSEAIRTNIGGTENVADACVERGIRRAILLSSDKAVNPINLYGATKLVAEKTFIATNHYTGKKKLPYFSVVRYGNVMGSRGSVIPEFKKQAEGGSLRITDERMTRFWITLDEAVKLVLKALSNQEGGEIFVPTLKSMRIVDLARAVAPNVPIEYTGIRPGEKIHEVLISKDEMRKAVKHRGYYVILPDFKGKPEANNLYEEYSSDNNEDWITEEEMRRML